MKTRRQARVERKKKAPGITGPRGAEDSLTFRERLVGDNLCIHAAVAVPARQQRGSVAITGIRAERLPRDPQRTAGRTPDADTSTSRYRLTAVGHPILQ